jgi:diguanylate cyclase (GGDEF)-like protein
MDLPTLMAMASFVSICAGVVLLIAWLQNRQNRALAIWGLANIVGAAGIVILVLHEYPPLDAVLGANLLALEAGLIWKSARLFHEKPAPIVMVLLGMAALDAANAVPGGHAVPQSVGLLAGAAYFSATAATFWIGRTDQLSARGPIVVLAGVHAAVLSFGAATAFFSVDPDVMMPPIISAFGLVHFERIVFTLGTAVFILAFVKERSEAASATAARIDALTGIFNRRAFMENAERVVERSRRDGVPVSVMMFDLDQFKAVNDAYGHAVGDTVLRRFCEVAGAALRSSDIFGRIGGEEFAVVLPRLHSKAAALCADRIRNSFAENCRIVDGHTVNATVSGGVTTSVDGRQTLSTLLERADAALYRAKAIGRNRVASADAPRPRAPAESAPSPVKIS